MSGNTKTIALSICDPNGIGPEIAVKAAAGLRGNDSIRIVLVGDEHVIRHYGESCAPEAVFQYYSNGTPSNGAILLHAVESLPAAQFRPGQVDAAAGRATVAYVEAAIGLIRKKAAERAAGPISSRGGLH